MRKNLSHPNTKDEIKADCLSAKRPTSVNAKFKWRLSQSSVAGFPELKGKSKQVKVDATGRKERMLDRAPVTPGAIAALPLGRRSPLYRVVIPIMERIVVLLSFRPSNSLH